MLYESDKWADSTISDVFKVFLEHIVQNSKRCSSHTRALVSREIRGSALHSRTFSISRSTLPTVNKIRLSQRKSKEHFQSCSKASRYPLIVLSWNRGKNADLLDPFLQDISIIIEKWKHERGQVIEVSFVFYWFRIQLSLRMVQMISCLIWTMS